MKRRAMIIEIIDQSQLTKLGLRTRIFFEWRKRAPAQAELRFEKLRNEMMRHGRYEMEA